MKITRHAKKRTKERCGNSSDRTAAIAFEKGLKHSECVGALSKYAYYLYCHNKRANNIRFYGNYVYIFCDTTLITVITLPSAHKKAVDKLMARKNAE